MSNQNLWSFVGSSAFSLFTQKDLLSCQRYYATNFNFNGLGSINHILLSSQTSKLVQDTFERFLKNAFTCAKVMVVDSPDDTLYFPL